MKKQWIALFLCALLVFAVGCSAPKSNQGARTEAAMPAPVEAPAAEAPAEYAQDSQSVKGEESGWSGGAGNAAGSAPDQDYGGHKVIKNAGLGLETREFDADLAYIKQKVMDMGGYISNSYVRGRKPENYNDTGRYASISIRIPQERMEAFLADARGIATVTYENSSGEDITSSYYDTESRLQIYETQRERILALLAKAETMEDIISLETELSRITYEIESLTTQLKRWDDLVDFATVTVDLTEIPPAVAVASNDDIGTRINEGLASTLSGMAVFFENLLVFLIAASPVLILLAIILVVVLLILRARRKKQAKLIEQGILPEKKRYQAYQPPQPNQGGYGTQPLPPVTPSQPPKGPEQPKE